MSSKCLLVYYSRTGNTKKVAESIAQELGAVTEEIVDQKKRGGAIGFMGGAKDSMFKKATNIDEPANVPSAFDMVIIGTPVWAAKMAPAVRTWLARFKDGLPKVAFFATSGGQSGTSTFKGMGELCGKQPISTLCFTEKQLKIRDWQAEVRSFVADLNSSV